MIPRILLSTLLVAATAWSANDQPNVTRHDIYVESDPGIRLFVRELSVNGEKETSGQKSILLIHGARVPGLASFDLDVPGGSLASDLAERGLRVFVMDVRGYGGSTRPKEMEDPPEASLPLVRSNEAARDIGAVVDWVRTHRHISRMALFGWATGGQWAGYYASIYPEKVSAFIPLNSLYGGYSNHPLLGHGSDMEDPTHPGHFNKSSCGAYRLNDLHSLFGAWDRSIPGQDKSYWRDPAVAKAYANAALASDPTSNSRIPPSFRSPCGALEDSFYLAIGHRLWDGSLITAPTLILASEGDFWSRPEDREMLAEDLVHAPKLKVVVLPNATHFVFLDRPEHGRTLLLDSISSFVAESSSP